MKRLRSVDKIIVITVLLLTIAGTVMIYSASALLAESRYDGDIYFVKRQLIWLSLSLVVIYLVSRFNYQKLIPLATPLIIVSLIFLIAVLFTREINGAKRWIGLGIVNFQPSEMFKYTLIIFLAALLASKKERIQEFAAFFFPAIPVIIVGFGLILLEPNLGTVLVLATVTFVLFFSAGIRLRYLTLLTGVLASIAAFMVFVLDYKRARIDDFLASVSNPLLASYQVKQSILAIGSGELFGRGLGSGSAKLFYLPAPHTDFIFSTLAEEGGFFLAMTILILLGVFVWRGLRAAIHAPDLMGFYLALGVTMLIATQAATNLLVATGMIPATGLPMPFISYGGSSVVFASIGVGILLNVSRYTVATPQLFKSRTG